VFGRKIPLFKILGFQINIDLSWFLIAILIAWSLAEGLFPNIHEGLSVATYWAMGVAGALGLFLSIVLHELGHSLIARRCGMEMRGITLFIFGGVAEMGGEPPSAAAEFKVAIAGPIVSLAIGVALIAVSFVSETLALPTTIDGVVTYLGWINLILVAFNMIPAFPLDGGRVLRAALWHLKGDLRWATRITSNLGGLFGLLLIALGVVSAIGGNFIGGAWWVILGLFLRGAAGMSYQQVLLRRALEGEPISRFMRREPVTVDPERTLRELVEDFVYVHHHKLYPVMRGDELLGCVTVNDIKSVPQERWDTTRVREIASECSESNSIEADADAMRALTTLNQNAASRLMVVERGRLVGVVALKDLLGFLSLKIDLEGE